MTYAGSVKRAKSHFENCNNGPEETPVQGDCSYILTPRATGAQRPSPAGPECKKQCLIGRTVAVRKADGGRNRHCDVINDVPLSLYLTLMTSNVRYGSIFHGC